MASLRRINQDDLRNHNLSVVIDTLLRASGPMSRADLAKETGLTKATMSLLVSLLIDAGVVKEGEPQNSASYGRPSTPLMLGDGKVCGVGMQVNTDGYGCMALDINHDILRHEWVDADMSGVEPDVVFGKLDAMAKAMAEDLESKRCIIAGVSCALPGLVTSDKRLLMARNLGWENVDLTTFDVMRGYDVTPCNEAKLAAIAQIPGYACARADVFDGVDCADSFLYLSCDIGIGGAIEKRVIGDTCAWICDAMPESRPRHVLGIAAVDDIFACVENGGDTFDCVAPARCGRNGAIFTRHGRYNIKRAQFKHDFGPLEEDCDCYTCTHYSRAYVDHALRAREFNGFTLATIHNEHFFVKLLDDIRASIDGGYFNEFRDETLAKFYENGSKG